MRLFDIIKNLYTKPIIKSKKQKPVKYLTVPDEDVKRVDKLIRDVTTCMKGVTPAIRVNAYDTQEVSRMIGLLELLQIQNTEQLRVFYSNLLLGQFSIQTKASQKAMLLAGATYFRRKYANPPTMPLYH